MDLNNQKNKKSSTFQVLLTKKVPTKVMRSYPTRGHAELLCSGSCGVPYSWFRKVSILMVMWSCILGVMPFYPVQGNAEFLYSWRSRVTKLWVTLAVSEKPLLSETFYELRNQ